MPGGHVLADPWPRIGARLIDGIIIGIVNIVLTLPFADVSGNGTSFSASVSGVGILVGLIVGAAYEIGFVGTQGATPGKMILKLRIVTQETGETPPGWDKAGLRYLPTLIGIIPLLGALASLVFLVLSLVWLFSDDFRRTIYDRFAGTYVVKA